MEKEDKNGEVGNTMTELIEQMTERYKKWDVELNEIYGVLKKQHSKEQMDALKEERNWISYRDETAKESSLKYEGSSSESLEYVATQATLTRGKMLRISC